MLYASAARPKTLVFLKTAHLVVYPGADPGGGPGGPGPPLTLGFEAPKLSIFGPYLIFP